MTSRVNFITDKQILKESEETLFKREKRKMTRERTGNDKLPTIGVIVTKGVAYGGGCNPVPKIGGWGDKTYA